MGENNNAGEEEVKDQNAENGGNDQEETQTEDMSDQQEEQGDSDQDENKDDTDSDKKEEEKPAPADEEPKTRKRNIDFILDRKNKQIQKLKEKVDSDEEDNDDELVDPEAKEMVQKEVQKALSPFIKKQMEEEDNQEIDSFLQANPDFKPYADRVRKFASHPSRQSLPIKSIFYEVAGPDLLKLGAIRAKKANDEAKETNAGGGSGDSGVTEKGIWDLSPEEFALKQEEIRNKNR